MELQKLPLETAALTGFTHKVVLKESDFTETTANTAQTIAIKPVLPGSYVADCAIRLKTPFKNSADAAFNTTAITIGDGNDVDRYLASTELNENGTEVLYAVGPQSTVRYVYTAADTIDIVVGSMAAKALADLNVGELWVFLNVVELSEAN